MTQTTKDPHTATPAGNNPAKKNSLQTTLDKNQKLGLGVLMGLLILVGGYFGYKAFILQPKEEKAAKALFPTQRWFEADSLNYVLNGDGQQQGALSVINKYGGTKSANLARYYAGMAYLKTGDFPNAIKQLEDFNGKNTPMAYLAFGALGDAYMETGQTEKGISFYLKAAGNKNGFTTPLFLFRAALAHEVNGKAEEAIKLYKRIRTEYPYSAQANNVEKYLARLGEVGF